ncbi:MAG: GAF domain-containing protein [Chloroflexi bacterium]|nr:GAF domain-containing protein [Chloroflexota bacterium]
MGENDLRDYLSELFSDGLPESEIEVEEELELSLLEEAVIFGLLGDESVPASVAVEQVVAEAPLPVPPEPEESGEERGTPLAKRRITVLRALLYGLIALGGAPFIFLLINLVWQEPVSWTPLCLVFYTLAVAVTVVQWLFNSSLTRAVQEAEGGRDEAIRSRTPLEGQVRGLAAANASLQKRAFQFQTITDISRAVAATLEQDRLVWEAVNLIRERFDLYHVGLFLIDESGEWAVLRAGAGEAGEQMLAQGYRFEASGDSLVGRCMAGAAARIALDAAVTQSRASAGAGEGGAIAGVVDTIDANSLLPKTRSEMALPLFSDGQVIGALDIHSSMREAFSAEDISVFQAMADQVAVALDNARLFAETQARLDELRQSLAREQRSRLSPMRPIPLYERTQPGVGPFGDDLLADVERAMAQREVLVLSGAGDGLGQAPSTSSGRGSGQAALVAPIALRGEIIGALGLQEMEGGRQWTEDEIALIGTVVDQMALAIENARLLEETQRRAEREQALSNVTARFTRSLNVDGLLRTAVRELGQLLQIDEVSIHVGAEATPVMSEGKEVKRT